MTTSCNVRRRRPELFFGKPCRCACCQHFLLDSAIQKIFPLGTPSISDDDFLVRMIFEWQKMFATASHISSRNLK